MAREISKKRKLISGANAAVVIAAAIGIAIALNAVSSQVFGRVDLTETGIYTLSEASEQAVAGLDEPVTVRAFISPDMPPPLHNLSQSVADTLDEYAAASGGKLTYELISPTDDADIEEDARSFGCEKSPIGQQTEDEVSLRLVYKCVAFSQGEDLEVVPNLEPNPAGGVTSFEYSFTKALLNLQETEPRKVGFVAGFGGPASSPQFIQSVQGVFDELYGDLIQAELVDLSGDEPSVPEDISALVVLHATEAFSDRAIFALDQFVQRGGSVGWYQSASGLDQRLAQQMMRQMPGSRPPNIRAPISTGLRPVFKEYGIDHKHDLLLDPQHGVTALAYTQRGLAQITQPATFMMSDIDRSLPFTRDFSAIALPAPSSVEVQPWAVTDESIEVYEVVNAPDTALRNPTPPSSFNYETLAAAVESGQPGEFTVAAALQGDVPSYYDKNPLPEGITEEDMTEESKPTRILVVGSGEFFQPMPSVGYDQQLAALGGQFLISSIEWLVQDNALTQIRSKALPRLLGEVPAETQRSLQFVNIAAVPAAFAMIGVVMMMRRRRRKESLQRSG